MFYLGQLHAGAADCEVSALPKAAKNPPQIGYHKGV
jgi:hypothetical protein